MRKLLIVVLAVVGSLFTVSAAQAALTTNQTNSFTVATTVGISSGAGGCGNPCSFGPLIAGVPSGSLTANIAIASNDPNGLQISTQPNGSNYTSPNFSENNCATPDVTRVVPASALKITSTPVSGGTGAPGTPAAAFNLSDVATNLWSTPVRATGTSMIEGVGFVVTPPAATLPNTATCSYALNVLYTATAL